MTEPAPTISAMAARAIVLAAATHGVSPPELCAKVGLDPAVAVDPDARISIAIMIRLWEEAALLDPDFGLHLAEAALAAQPALPWHLVRASATLGDGILRLVAAWRVFNDLHPPELVIPFDGSHESAKGGTRDGLLRMRTKDTPWPVPRHAAEYAFAWFVVAARRATGVELAPRSIWFEHPRPSSIAEHERIFRCELRFDAPATSIVFPGEAIALPTIGNGDPELVELLERHTQTLLARLPKRGAFADRVRAAMAPLLASADVTIERVALALEASPRSVQRRLRDESTTFQRVLDDLRKDIATAHLVARVIPIAEIALLLGFSDQTAFHRAFVRWTGRTPGDVRRAAR